MDTRSAADLYRAASIEDAPPLKIVRLLYAGAVRFIDRAAACDPADPRSEFVACLGRADAVVSELRLALASEHAPEVSAELERLYLFVEAGLQRAMSERSRAPLEGARGVLTRLLQAWDQAGTPVS